MPFNSQVGAPLTQRNAPIFTGYTVVSGTWKPTDLLTDKATKGKDAQVFNVSFTGPGSQVTCELVQDESNTSPDLKKSDVITEAADSTPWLVMKCDPIGFDDPPIIFQVTLMRSAALDLTQVESHS